MLAAPEGPLSVRFYGVSTLLFDDGQNQLLVDGFFSRPNLLQTALFQIGPDPEELKEFLRKQNIRRPSAILTAHAHHDHALDASEIAAQTSAVLVGSRSVANLGFGRRLSADKVCIVKDGDALIFGPYEVKVMGSPHGDTGRFLGWLLSGDIERPLPLPAWFGALNDSENYAYLIKHGGRSILVHPSASFTPGRYAGEVAPLVFLGVGGLGNQTADEIEEYWAEVVGAVHATTVVPVHWDAFTRPLSKPLKPPPAVFDPVDLAFTHLRRLGGSAVSIRRLAAFQAIEISASGEVRGRPVQ